jgi:TonB family protein
MILCHRCSVLIFAAGMFVANAFHAAAQPVPAALPDARGAVDTVTRLFTPNPAAVVESTGKPLPTNGTWGVQMKFTAGTPESCRVPGMSCVRVLYRVPEANTVCAWTVGFVHDAAAKQGNGSGPAVRPVIVDEDTNAALYTLKKDWIEGEARWHLVSWVRPTYPTIAAEVHAGGDVPVRIIVGRNGKVERVQSTSGPKILQGAVIDAVKQWVFAPLVVGSQSTSFQIDWVYHFRGQDGSSTFSDMGVGGQTFRLPNEHEGPGMVPTSTNGTTWEKCESAATGCAPVAPEVPK